MTTKKRHDTMRKAKPIRLTARKGRTYGVSVIDTIAKRAARLKKKATLRDLVGAAMDNGMEVKIGLKPQAVEQPHKFEVRNGFVVDSIATPEQALTIAERIRRAMSEGTRAHKEAEATALNRAHDVSPGEKAEADAWNQFRAYNQADDKPNWGKFGSAERIHGYLDLEEVLVRAYQQAAVGKGYERHGRGLRFSEQPTQVISDLLDSDAGLAFQAIKKVNEGMRLEHDAKIKEMLGAINYIASIVIRMERNKK